MTQNSVFLSQDVIIHHRYLQSIEPKATDRSLFRQKNSTKQELPKQAGFK
jgi:hypothetical protein